MKATLAFNRLNAITLKNKWITNGNIVNLLWFWKI